MKIIQLIQTQSQVYKLDGPEKLRFFTPMETPESRVEFVEKLVELLQDSG